MNTTQSPTATLYPDDRRLFTIGGASALIIALGYIVIVLLYALAGAPPVGGKAWLDYLAGKTAIWWGIIGLSVLTNFLFVPVALALFVALRSISRYAMAIAVAFVGLFVTLELAVNWTCYAALVMLSTDYAAATTDAHRATLIAAASFPSAVIASPLALVYAIGTLSFAILIIGLVMTKGIFNRVTAWLGIATGLLGLAAVAGVGIAVILNALAATAWLLLVGYKLIRLAGV